MKMDRPPEKKIPAKLAGKFFKFFGKRVFVGRFPRFFFLPAHCMVKGSPWGEDAWHSADWLRVLIPKLPEKRIIFGNLSCK